MDSHPIQGVEGVKILIVTSCYRNWDKLWPDGPTGSYVDFTLPMSIDVAYLFILSKSQTTNSELLFLCYML